MSLWFKLLLRFALLASVAAAPILAGASPDTHGRVRPLRQIYKTHQGWEYRTEHFIAVTTTSGDDARWAGDELEAAWEETARLADHFGDMHRRPDFGMVGALVTKNSTVPRSTGTRFPKIALPADPTTIQVEMGEDREASRAAARQTLRRGAASTLLRQSGYDERLPKWAAVGLTEFVADEEWDKQRFDHERKVAQQSNESLPAWGVVFRHLMTTDDGGQAASILESLSDCGDFSAGRLQRRVPIHTRWDKVTAKRAEVVVQDNRLPELPGVRPAELRKNISRWLADPQVGTMPVKLDIADNDPAMQRAREMALLVKLWQRYGEEHVARGENRPATPIDLDKLHRRLTSSTAPAWSALDADGHLMTWRDQPRVDALLADRRGGYRTMVREGRSVLQFREPEGTTLEAWLDGAAEPARPVVRVQRVKAL
ncbi:MAG: hypothetical protein K8T91_22650 [Planctomycetes bacterium]|nr:hypothetical protein [Planctomycetota bacterium]